MVAFGVVPEGVSGAISEMAFRVVSEVASVAFGVMPAFLGLFIGILYHILV